MHLSSDYSEIEIALNLDDRAGVPNLQPGWNVAPSDDVLVVRFDRAAGRRISEKMKWGLIPAWSKEAKMMGATFNAKAEAIDRTSTFRDAWRAGRRCLVVANGFYEWRKRDKQPFAIARAKQTFTVMAGLWEEWRARDGSEVIRSCTIITTDANDLIGTVHDRMPVILAEQDWPAWLGEARSTEAALKALLKPYPAAGMELWPVGHAVGNWRNNGPELLTPTGIDDGLLV
ncbi:MAG TPA: SOS response-associated peptidase [Alphaproteobacteria bacterium]|nr:SOS response-associated peptidase [Alphaproteobacteria bacterium]